MDTENVTTPVSMEPTERFSLYAAVPSLTPADVITLSTLKVVILLLGLLGNLPLIWIFTRSKKIRNEKVFQLTLAVVDLLALFTLLPYSVFQHFLPRVVAVYYLAFFCTIVVGHAYHFTITLFTVFRYIAVYRPFESKSIHSRWSPKVPLIVCVYSLSNAVVNVGLDLIEFYNRNVWISFAMLILNFSQIFVSLCVMATLYVKIIWKLKTDPLSGSVHSAGQLIRVRRQHMNVVKVFLAVTFCSFFSYAIAMLVFFLILNWRFASLYFLNHVCNPYIYIALNRCFRKKFLDLFKFW